MPINATARRAYTSPDIEDEPEHKKKPKALTLHESPLEKHLSRCDFAFALLNECFSFLHTSYIAECGPLEKAVRLRALNEIEEHKAAIIFRLDYIKNNFKPDHGKDADDSD